MLPGKPGYTLTAIFNSVKSFSQFRPVNLLDFYFLVQQGQKAGANFILLFVERQIFPVFPRLYRLNRYHWVKV